MSKDKLYVVSEEELLDLFEAVIDFPISTTEAKKEVLQTILKSKKPVQIIAEGKIESRFADWNIGKFRDYHFVNFLDKNNGKSGKLIFIKKEE